MSSPSPGLTQERPSAVPGAGVYAAPPVTRAEHVVRDVVILVDAHTVRHRDYWDLQHNQSDTCSQRCNKEGLWRNVIYFTHPGLVENLCPKVVAPALLAPAYDGAVVSAG